MSIQSEIQRVKILQVLATKIFFYTNVHPMQGSRATQSSRLLYGVV